MITLRSATQRHHLGEGDQHVWSTFHAADQTPSFVGGFGDVEALNEIQLPPGAVVIERPHGDAELVTYVHRGALAYQDSLGRSGVVYAGEFQRMTLGRAIKHRQANASETTFAHVLQLWLHPARAGLEQSIEQRRFSAAERRGALRVVASPDARRGSLHLQQDTVLYSAMLRPGQHVIHELASGRCAWLHVVDGAARLADHMMSSGDGAGVTDEVAVSLTAHEETELLLVETRTVPRSP
jgi:redox-sensitive bicupin YhaK (pirin superfamily)